VGTVYGVQLAASAKNASGTGTLQLVTRSGGDNYVSSNLTVGNTAYNYVLQMRETDPDTATAWTVDGVNAAEFGIKKIA
jgi:hypothetical protein